MDKPSSNSDNKLINQIRSGNTGAFEILIEKYKKLVSHIVFRMVANMHDREDICQDVFVKIYQNIAGFRFDWPLQRDPVSSQSQGNRLQAPHENGHHVALLLAPTAHLVDDPIDERHPSPCSNTRTRSTFSPPGSRASAPFVSPRVFPCDRSMDRRLTHSCNRVWRRQSQVRVP